MIKNQIVRRFKTLKKYVVLISGSVRPVQDNRGRRRFIRSVENEELILELVQNNPELSCRRISANTAISSSVVWRILRENNLYPYHRQQVQELLPHDHDARFIFAQTILGNIAGKHF